MPPLIAAAVAGLTSALTSIGIGASLAATLAQGIVTAVVNLAVGLAVSGISAALSSSPQAKRPKLQQRRDQQNVTVRNPTQSRELVFGRVRKGGTFAFIGTTNDGFDLHMVIMLAGHKVIAIREVYFNDELAFDADGKVQPNFDSQAFLTKHLGEDNQAADTELIARLVDGVEGNIIDATNLDPVVITTEKPHRMETGDTVYMRDVPGMTEINDREILVDVPTQPTGSITSATNDNPVEITSASHGLTTGDTIVIQEVEGMLEINNSEFVVTVIDVDTFSLDDEDGTGNAAYTSGGTWRRLAETFSLRNEDGTAYGTYGVSGSITGASNENPVVITSAAHGRTTGDTVRITGVGGMTEINNRDFTITVIDINAFSLDDEDGTLHGSYTSGGTWELPGGTWERRPWTTDHRLQGIAYIYVRLFFNSDLYQGVPNITAVLDGYDQVYDPRDGSTGLSSNPSLCQAAYLNHPLYGLDAPYDDEFDEAALIAAANINDEAAVHPSAGTETRYTLNGVVDSGELPRRNIETLLSANLGRLIFSGGEWVLKAAGYETPTIEFDENDLRGNITIRARLPRRSIFNAVRGVFVSEKTRWVSADFPVVKSPAYEAKDNGERIWKDIELPFTTSETMCQRLAKIDLEATRREIGVSGAFSLKALQVRAGDTIMLTLDRAGWNKKPFYVTDWRFAIVEGEKAPLLEISLDLRETDSAVYAITASEIAEIENLPSANFENPVGAFSTFIYQVEDLDADEDLGFRTILKADKMFTLTSAVIRSQGTPTGIDASNTCEIKLRKNGSDILTKTFNDSTPFPDNGDLVGLGSVNIEFEKGDKLKIRVTNGATADPPAFILQSRLENV